MQKLTAKWLELVNWMSSKGIPLAFVRDPKTQKPSVSLTLLIVSFTFCIGAIIGKIDNSKLFGDLNFQDSFSLFMASAGLYFGRKLQNDVAAEETPQDPPSDKPSV